MRPHTETERPLTERPLLSRKAFLRGHWLSCRSDEAAPSAGEPAGAEATEAMWGLPPELRGEWLYMEAARLGLDPGELDEDTLARAVMLEIERPV